MDDNPYQAPQAPIVEVAQENAAHGKRKWRTLVFTCLFAIGALHFVGRYMETGRPHLLSLVIVFCILTTGGATIFIAPHLERRIDSWMRILCPLTMIVGLAWLIWGR